MNETDVHPRMPAILRIRTLALETPVYVPYHINTDTKNLTYCSLSARRLLRERTGGVDAVLRHIPYATLQ